MSELTDLDPARRDSPTRSVARGAMAFLGTQPFTWGATLLSTVVVPRFLGDNGLGQYAVVASVAGLAQTAATFGIPSYLTRRVASRSDRDLEAAGAALILVAGFALLLGASLALLLPAFGFRVGDPLLLPVSLAAAVLSSAQWVVLAVLVGQERYAKSAWLGAAGSIVGPVVSVGVVMAGGDVLALVESQVVVGAWALLLTYAGSGVAVRRSAFSLTLWRELASGGWPFLTWNIAARIRSDSDRIVLVILSNASSVGWYAAAWRIIAVPMFIPMLIATPLLPALSRTAQDRGAFEQTLRRSLVAALILVVPLSAMIIALAPAIPHLLGWQEEFTASVPIMAILAAHQPVLVANMLLGTALIAMHAERRWLTVGIAGAVLNPAMNLAVVPLAQGMSHNAGIGAAIVVFATELIMLTGALLLLPRGMLDRSTLTSAIRVGCAGIALIGVAMVLRTVSLPLAIVASGGTYAAAIVVLGVMRPRDIRTIIALAWRSRPSHAVAV